jgi:hypothetical protein
MRKCTGDGGAVVPGLRGSPYSGVVGPRSDTGQRRRPESGWRYADSPITDEEAKHLAEHYARRYRLQSVRMIRGFKRMDWRFDDDEQRLHRGRGPKSLAELVAVIDPSAPQHEGDVVTLELGGDEYAAVQYDEVDKAVHDHHRVPVGRRGTGPSAGRANTREGRCSGLGYRMTSDADDSFLIEAQKV